MNATHTFGELLTRVTPDQTDREQLRRQRRRILLPIVTAAVLLCAWSATAPLSGAIVAPAELKVELNRKMVQHQEGGIVRDIRVRNGQKVHAGDPLVVLGDMRSSAELALLQNAIRAESVRSVRANAEATLSSTLTIPAALSADPLAHDDIARESALFVARRRTLDEQIAALGTQIHEAQLQAAALQSQIDATGVSAQLSNDELALNEKLVHDGFVPSARVLQLKRAEADYRSKMGETRSDLALAKQRAGDLQARIAQARNQYQQQAADELKDSAAKQRDLEERLRPSLDQVDRQTVRSPVDGEVMNLRVSAVGDVIAPREAIAEVVPSRERLVVEAHIRPQDITYVRVDGVAEVRLAAFDARATPLLPGRITFVSADRVTKPDTNDSFYLVTVDVDARSLRDHPEIELQAGMPAELFVTTPTRTLLQYFTRPFAAFSRHALREP